MLLKVISGKLAIILFVLSPMFFSSSSYAKECNKYLKESCSCKPPVNGYCITAGGKKYTYYKIANDLKGLVAPDAGFDLKPMEGGSVINVKRMRWQNGVKLAIVQSDVLETYKAEAKKGNKLLSQIINPLRVILPLYNEEVHIFTRKDSGIDTFKDLRGKRIALGSISGGSAMTGRAIYSYMFGEELTKENANYSLNDSDALRALMNNETIDAWIKVVGQPATKFEDIQAGAGEIIKLVEFDESDFQEAKVLNGPYFSADILAENYPWLNQDVPTVTVKAFLISQVYTRQSTKNNIQKLTKSLCQNFSKLRSHGHEKWKDVSLEQVTLPGGWKYSDDALLAYSSPECRSQVNPSPLKPKTCSVNDELLGLCIR